MIRLIVLLIAFGVVSWLITFLPLGAPWPTLIYAAMIIAIIWEILAMIGYTSSIINRK